MAKAAERRAYDSPRRREQARATRHAVIEASRDLFTTHGYVGTTVEAIATRAEVSPETVYAVFANKRTILSDLLDVTMAGDDEPVPILERPWVRAMAAEPRTDRRVRILARNARLILQRTNAVYEVLRAAAGSDPQIASLLERNRAQRFAGQRELIRILTDGHPLHDGLTVATAADVLFAIGSPETYRSLVIDRGWSAARFERWYADTLTRLLL
jgi:AcrR family transcriptional regulator